MRLKYVKRTCKKNRQELLNMALKEELEYLRKKIYPWERREFLINNVEIKERKFYLEEDMQNVAGLYEWFNEKTTHKIYVDRNYIISTQKVPLAYYRRYNYRKLREIIRHELIHAFVNEEWEYKCKCFIEDKNVDASPIFLSILYFCNGYTNHYCLKGFQKTELYEFARYEATTYKELEEYLNNYLIKISEEINKIKEFTNKDSFIKKTDKDFYCISNKFSFSPRECGMYKFLEIYTEDIHVCNQAKKSKCTCINRIWKIGCNVKPDKIIKLYNKKQNCKAVNHEKEKQYVIIPDKKEVTVKDCKFIKIKEKKYKNERDVKVCTLLKIKD